MYKYEIYLINEIKGVGDVLTINSTEEINNKATLISLGKFIIPVSNIAGITVEYIKRQSAADEELEEQVRSL